MADMFYYEIDLSRLKALATKLKKGLSLAERNKLYRRIAEKIGVKAEELSGGYPPQPAPRHHPNSSEETQKRKLKPYRRTGRLGASLHSRVETEPGGVYVAVLGTDPALAPYSPYVWALPEDEPGQAWMHTGIWTPLAEAITRDAGVYVAVAEDEMVSHINAFLA